VIGANAIAATVAVAECGSSTCGHLAHDTKPPRQAGTMTTSVSNPIANANVSLR